MSFVECEITVNSTSLALIYIYRIALYIIGFDDTAGATAIRGYGDTGLR